jgi:4-hydroxybenzoate polyprenyltransferase
LDSAVPWLLFVANIFWSLSYDTAYALADRDDDKSIGVKSTALWLGDKAVMGIIALGMIMIALLGAVAWQYGMMVKIAWLVSVCYQIYLCIRLWQNGETWGFIFFLKSHVVGLLFSIGFIFQALL